MKYGIVKLRETGLTSYNLDIFEEGEEVIAIPLEEFQTEILRLKYYLEKSTEKSEDILKGRVRYKKQVIGKIGDEMFSAKRTIDSLSQFNLQTSLEDFNWPEVKTRKRKRISTNRPTIPALAGLSEV